ncbi:Protein phosphatase 2C (PP2C)-like domain-containing protein [Strongyloides ratti]|uniref:Protein phosphatase 2C (PP2C)-like domain-containing protein n=1 Tax=Strongyloides ratti TaxID=34506 RepID=A0A090L8I1_STRRB|nr:Protein phosphatase 2C (PP2C)-like domain-containing protein [Strongyloides ratti]CEF66086.1 Protein phosphatase 2C (PP2C)-like domain-containing protein [Strongyloides ratti]
MGNESNHELFVENPSNITNQNETSKLYMNFHITACSKQGGRKYMEDRCQLDMKRNENDELEYIFAGVYDGHGGDEASKYTRNHLLENIKLEKGFLSDNDNEFLQAIKNGFLMTHDNMEQEHVKWKKNQNGYNSTAGTTVTTMFIRNKKLYVGHVGDSAIFVVRQNHNLNTIYVDMATKEHKPNDKTELERIQNYGGRVVKKSNCHRVVWQRSLNPSSTSTRPSFDIPFLAISRSLGDFWSYNHMTNRYVVSPEPDCFTIEIEDDFMGFILCSDGVTGVLGEEHIAKIITDTKHESQENCKENGLDRNNYARIIVKNALNPQSYIRSDNITAIAIMCKYTNKDDNDSTMKSEKPSIPFNLDEELTIYPRDCVVIKPKSQERFRTTEVNICYNGPKDPAYKNATCVIGPGYEVEEETNNMNIKEKVGETSDGGYVFYEKPCFVKVSKDQKKILNILSDDSKEDVKSLSMKTIDEKVVCLVHGYNCRRCTIMLLRIDLAKSKIKEMCKNITRKESKTTLAEIKNVEGTNSSSDSVPKNIFSYFIKKLPLFKFTKGKHDKSDIKHFNSLTALPTQPTPLRNSETLSKSFDSLERLRHMDNDEIVFENIGNEGNGISPTKLIRPNKRKFDSTFCNKENSDSELNPPPEKKNRIWSIFANLVSSLSHKNTM